MANTLSGLDTLHCTYVVPDSRTSDVVSRWSDTNISAPALVVTPENEQDVQAAIRVAKDNGLSITVAGGGHGTFVTVDSRTLYLDLSKFKDIELDKEEGTVRVGGGVVTGELLRALAVEDYYTPLPNSNAVGVVGCIIGGGSTPLNGLHGWMADIVVSFRLVTSEGKILELSSSSVGPDSVLFHALCGAGHGLGVITAVTTSAYPLAALGMTDNKIWLRSLIFPAHEIHTAAQAFLDIGCPSAEASISLTFMRSPPGTPAAGQPIIFLGSTYFGPAEDAEKETLLFREDVVGKTVRASTEMMEMANLNDRFEPHNAHGGHKAIASCRLKKTSAQAIKDAFEEWKIMTDAYADARNSLIRISAFNTMKHMDHEFSDSGAGRFLESRDRGISAMAIVSCTEEKTAEALREYMDETMAVFRQGDQDVAPRSFPNNLRFGMELEEMFCKEQLEDLREIKKVWDAEGIFWSPYQG